jgi:hypothetical protein
MAMKGRKRKRKPKGDSRPAAPVAVSSESDAGGDPVEIEVEVVNVPSTTEIRSETENPAMPDLKSIDTEKPVSISIARSATDRRTHPRYAFAAAIEVVAPELGERIKSRVRDLSQKGCYVDTDRPLELGTITAVCISKGPKSFSAPARVVYNQPGKGMGLMFTAVEPGQLATLNTWIEESREASWLADNRRRSQRVMMRIPVRITGQTGAMSEFAEETYTVSISRHGALLVAATPMCRGQRFTLANAQTKAALECVVVHVVKHPGEQTQVGVEFLLANPTFWHVAFPPRDWTPRHPDAKSL